MYIKSSNGVKNKVKLQNILSEAKTNDSFVFHDIYCQMSDSNKHIDDYKSCILPIEINLTSLYY